MAEFPSHQHQPESSPQIVVVDPSSHRYAHVGTVRSHDCRLTPPTARVDFVDGPQSAGPYITSFSRRGSERIYTPDVLVIEGLEAKVPVAELVIKSLLRPDTVDNLRYYRNLAADLSHSYSTRHSAVYTFGVLVTRSLREEGITPVQQVA